MAIYRLEAKIISRGREGHSVVAASAYRTGTKMRDERAGKVHDYSRRKTVVESIILRPENAPGWSEKSTSLWNMVEATEKRKDAQLGREFILSLPKELSHKENFDLAVEWAQKELVSKGMVAELSFHDNAGNPHVHVLATMRTLDGDKFNAKKSREWNEKAQLHSWRESWCKAENTALEKAGRPERVDHRSLKDQGVDRIPEPKQGKEANGLKKRGVVADPWRFQMVRFVKMLNVAKPWLNAIRKFGEVRQHGAGRSWWERSLLLGAKGKAVGQSLRGTIQDAWQSFKHSRTPPPMPPGKSSPEPDIDLTR